MVGNANRQSLSNQNAAVAATAQNAKPTAAGMASNISKGVMGQRLMQNGAPGGGPQQTTGLIGGTGHGTMYNTAGMAGGGGPGGNNFNVNQGAGAGAAQPQ